MARPEVAGGRAGRLTPALVFALISLLCLGCSFAPRAEAAPPSAKVTILPYAKGYFGEIAGSVGTKCAANRRVVAFVRRPGMSRFGLLGKAKTRRVAGKLNPDRGTYQWRVRLTAEGRLYARAEARKGCPEIESRVIKGLPVNGRGGLTGEEIPPCPARGKSYCRLAELHLDGSICPSFTAYAGSCGGSIGGPSPWWSNGGNFHWSDRVGNYRTVEMSAYTPQDMSVDKWRIEGSMSGPEKAEWMVYDAWNKGDGEPVLHWQAADVDIRAGELGGPLHINFRNGIIGADIFVRGYMYLK
ncbi:MAG TPA: hypothetical protein VMF31_03655 [Solirubrobacterales bacterium]|nr:hypothetical protein [Solirubrobacterales bacterium]